MTKRCRIIGVLCYLAAGMLEASVLAAEMKLTNRQLAEKAQRLQALVEQKLVQAHGMIPMFVRAGDYRQGRTGLLKDGTWPTFWTYDSKPGKMRPQRQASFGAFDARTGRSALFAMGCVTAHRWLPQEKMLGDARHVLDNLDETTMRFVLPLDDQHPLPPEWQAEAKMLDGDSLTGWLCAYWEGRYRGYW